MLKERDYASVARMLDRSLAMRGDDEPERGDPADDIDFCTDVLEALAPLRKLLADEVAEGDPDDTTAWAVEALGDVDEMIQDMTVMLDDLKNDTEGAEPGYVPG